MEKEGEGMQGMEGGCEARGGREVGKAAARPPLLEPILSGPRLPWAGSLRRMGSEPQRPLKGSHLLLR